MTPQGAPIVGGAAGPGKSTAPQFSAMPVVDGMPVAWPLPTKTQQKLSTTTSVQGANQAIQEMSAGGAAMGEIMQPHDLQSVRNTLGMLLESSAQDGNMKKRDDIAKRLEELYAKLQAGQIKTIASQKVLELVRQVEQQNYPGAAKLQQELMACDWELNKNWLMGLKRIVPQR
jgi:protein transport protein SEC31